ncbi:MAG: STAS domain-containing protein [Roseiflexaceae bacterium]
MRTLYRQVVFALLGLQLFATLLLLFILLSTGAEAQPVIAASSALIICTTLLLAYWRGQEWARYADVVAITLLTGFGLNKVGIMQLVSLIVLVPPALALVLTPPIWMLGSAVVLLIILIGRGNGAGIYTDSQTLVYYWVVVACMFLSRMIADAARRDAYDQASRAEAALDQSERQARDLARQANDLSEQNARQQQLLYLVTTLETPVVSLADGVLLAPLVWHLDSRRAEVLTTRLLDEASAQRARLIVLDIAGVTTVDAEVMPALLGSVRALRLVGCAAMITGISADVAIAFTQLGATFDDVATARSPQEALARYATERATE